MPRQGSSLEGSIRELEGVLRNILRRDLRPRRPLARLKERQESLKIGAVRSERVLREAFFDLQVVQIALKSGIDVGLLFSDQMF